MLQVRAKSDCFSSLSEQEKALSTIAWTSLLQPHCLYFVHATVFARTIGLDRKYAQHSRILCLIRDHTIIPRTQMCNGLIRQELGLSVSIPAIVDAFSLIFCCQRHSYRIHY
uniref:Uncharacterized protein n=1 Tax=Hyaloperonospora arabidopsidis (strain Emoy2) TaxID=559515 RepID=M4BCS7_HYAAE